MHRTVLLQEVVSALAVRRGEVFVDCTLGGGGHMRAIAAAAGGACTLIGIDEDEDALIRARKTLDTAHLSATLCRDNFRNLDTVLAGLGIALVHAFLFDLGVSTEEILESGRGFSFGGTGAPEPLLMSFRKEGAPVTARAVVNEWSEENLKTIIAGFVGERYAGRIARAIAAARAEAPIETNRALADIVAAAVPAGARRGKIHPATKTFQAIRMAVNDERGALEVALPKALRALASGGRIAVISFHSGEDRIVKHIFKAAEKRGEGKTSKKPIVPSPEEVKDNPRARSAQLRIFKKYP